MTSDDADSDAEMRENFARGDVASVLPYDLQDDYGRDLRPVEHLTAVLENERLRATFLLGLGGRLWSLVDKTDGRELLYSNRVIQYGNLALRDAWFAGGVEWNEGLVGHHPHTCSPVHAARIELDDGTPVLRLWEFDRIRETIFQIDAWLPSGAESLLVHGTITNPNPHEVATYWWSNIAAPEPEGVRVVVPAERAWECDYAERWMRRVPRTEEAVDRTRPTEFRTAADFFWEVDEPGRPWIASIGPDGRGIVQSSSRALRGRKLFLWGRGKGGRTWQRWLSPAGGDYLEIQAGLARTQLEHLAMPAGARWSWLETYGPIQADASVTHGDDWDAARSAVRDGLRSIAPEEWFRAQADVATSFVDRTPAEILQHGSGWGALETMARADGSLDLPGTPFSAESLGPLQEPWMALIRTGRLPETSVGSHIGGFQVSPLWRTLLEGASDWLGLLHLGIALWHDRDHAGAEQAWRASLAVRESGWAWRNLAVLEESRGESEASDAAYARAVELLPRVARISEERIEQLISHGAHRVAFEALTALEPSERTPVMTILLMQAAVGAGELDRVASLFETPPELPRLREGERALDAIWYEYQAARRARQADVPLDDHLRSEVRRNLSLPDGWDFRMAEEA
ncbi:DUF5107 domain-containing protein [Microbacterium sp. 179-I 3D2 NHS]|uniref:DUF5107 domain-containing protein n=1 Tax=Microbacterium sp. 179-I 3D2 NHS TaxID=3235178 RepID=UPI0039A3D3D9